eukprot:TRINITY_DN10001_c0_g1_i1.p1 TRINITY_DN10001_c0_g1~~TRINITY_DN10001_c0_g1_i1.p1  ORF type:complete len:308 (-),score=81.15 TRINITY_DN10001_c0_g1_i1:161-1084(-)
MAEWDYLSAPYVANLVPRFQFLYDEMASLVTGGAIVDFGTGPGEPLLTIYRRFVANNALHCCRFFGLDVSSKMLDFARERAAKLQEELCLNQTKPSSSSVDGIEFIQEAEFNFPLDKLQQPQPQEGKKGDDHHQQLIDCITCSLVFPYIEDKLEAFKRVRKLLTPASGVLLLSCWSTPDRVPCLSLLQQVLHMLKNNGERLSPESLQAKPVSSFSMHDVFQVRQQLIEAGFRAESIKMREVTLPMKFDSVEDYLKMFGPGVISEDEMGLAKEYLFRLASEPTTSLQLWEDSSCSLPSVAIVISATNS